MSASHTEISSDTAAAAWHGLAHLAHWGVIRAQGADAASFLHGQLTQDFVLLGQHEARLAGYCSAKGRMLASFIGCKRAPDEILLVCHRDLLAATLKRLSMFVLRAKVKLSDASADYALDGVVGAAVPAELDAKPWAKTEIGADCWVRLPDSGVARALRIAPAASARADATLELSRWNWLEVRSGVALVSQALTEEFVPQMLNYESIGGVNFKKGCYPGQEVVARSQYRGVLKRRAQIVHGESELAVGQPVFHASDAEQPCGLVVVAAPCPSGGWDAIVSLQTSALDGQALTAASPHGVALRILPLPYELLQDI